MIKSYQLVVSKPVVSKPVVSKFRSDIVLNKLGKKICAGVGASSMGLGFNSNVKSDALVWDAVVTCAESYMAFRLMQYRVVGPMLKMLKKQTAVEVELNNIVEKVPGVSKTISVSAGFISVILSIDAGNRVVDIVSSLKNDKKGEQEDPKKADAKNK